MAATKLDAVSIDGLTIPKGYSLAGDGISQSLLGCFQTCRRRWLLAVNGWWKRETERKTGYGSMNHGLLDLLYRGYFSGDFTKKDFPEVIRIYLDKYKFPPVFPPQEIEQLKALSQATMEQYVQYYSRDFTDFRLKAVERVFDVTWKGFRLRGKVDGTLADKTGALWNLEHKNYGRINEDTIQKRLSFDLQNMFYLHADSVEFNRRLKGVIYNIIRKPEVKKFNQPFEMYKYVKELMQKNPNYYFIRYEIPYTERDIQQFRRELFEKLTTLETCINNVRSGASATTVFFKNECACDQPYQCDFLDACASGRLVGYCKGKLFIELGDNDEAVGVANIKKSIHAGGAKRQVVAAPIKEARPLATKKRSQREHKIYIGGLGSRKGTSIWRR